MTFHFFTGFLGYKTDFDHIIRNLESKLSIAFDSEVHSVSSDFEFSEEPSSLEVLTVLTSKVEKTSGPRIGIGYSLGGRILLQLMQFKAGLFDAVIFLSTNPGLADEQVRLLRCGVDERWAKRFLRDEWVDVIHDWNAQDVFNGSGFEPDRPIERYRRSQLAWILREFSVGRQKDFRTLLGDFSVPIYWLVGEFDKKYVAVMSELKELHRDKIQFDLVTSAGHRFYLDQPDQTSALLAKFIQELGLLS